LFIKFAYNKNMHSIIDYSLFRIVYGFNLLTLWNLIYLLLNERISLLRQTWVIKALHESFRQYIEKKMNNIFLKLTKVIGVLTLNQVIWFWCI